MEMLKFMWFKEGKFINPLKKNDIINQYIEEEIENYNNGIINVPQIEFCITTKCTLKCKDCCALIPQLDKVKHSEMSFEDFKLQLDKICDSVEFIRLLVILGGEPLVNSNLDKMIEYASQKEKIFFIKIITNGTMLPSKKLLDIMSKYHKKVFVYMSNYQDNPELKPILKQEEIKKILADNNIKVQKPENWSWYLEPGLVKDAFSDEITKEKFMQCYRTKCIQVMNGYIDICSKATAARELGEWDIKDSIDIFNSENLREDLINFYQKPFIDACSYCAQSDVPVKPALQDKG